MLLTPQLAPSHRQLDSVITTSLLQAPGGVHLVPPTQEFPTSQLDPPHRQAFSDMVSSAEQSGGEQVFPAVQLFPISQIENPQVQSSSIRTSLVHITGGVQVVPLHLFPG